MCAMGRAGSGPSFAPRTSSSPSLIRSALTVAACSRYVRNCIHLNCVCGHVSQVVLVSQDIYQYTHADFYGVCSWIPWVYFLGAPAVGNLARGVERAYHRATADAAE